MFEWIDAFRFNFYSLGYLIVASFQFYAYLITLGIKNRSITTKYLGWFFLTSTLLCISFSFGHSYMNPVGAYHRWGTVFSSLILGIFQTQIFLHFPGSRPKLSFRIIYVAMLAVALIGLIYFIFKSLSAPIHFSFSAQAWDFDADQLSRNIGLVILSFSLGYLLTGLIRFITDNTQRLSLILLLLGDLFCAFIPGVLNVASRDGAIDRSTFVTIFTLLGVIGCFLIILLFINRTPDRTSFMEKIIGITLVTVSVMLSNVAYFTLSGEESKFDNLKLRDSKIALLSGNRADQEVYRLEYDSINISKLSGDVDLRIDDIYKQELENKRILINIKNISPDSDYTENLQSILRDTNIGFSGHKRAIEDYMASPQYQSNSKGVLGELDSLERIVLYRSNKIRQIPTEGFREKLTEFLESSGADFSPYAAAIRDLMSKRSESPNEALKSDVLVLLVPAHSAQERYYRSSIDGTHQYISFMLPNDDKIIEIGYPYMLYRDTIHEITKKLMWLLLGCVLLVLIGFRFFFSGALVKPLGKLLTGVTKVNEGDLNIQVTPGVEDEIGFLTKSFNGMVGSIRDARFKLQEYANHLEDKVKERTAELEATLSEVQALKNQQDGDYFLTSLLIKPLATNRVNSEVVNVSFLMRQKKRFQFRHWKEEIGGDICIADSLTLDNRPFTVIVNADAMGKSMQGAGGALVLGSVFDAILQRTKSTASMQNQFPERWIKNAFTELNKVFEGFDGSMLVSLALGLLDETSGLLYYINAEHPWSILYRKGKASFLEQEMHVRKLGMPSADGNLSVLTFQLASDDVVIIGSDGRDDIEKEDGLINEDEFRILSHVEKANGDLEGIFDSVSLDGRLIDDFSLIRLGYKENSPTVHVLLPATIQKLVEEAAAKSRAGDHEGAIQSLEWARSVDNTRPEVIRKLVRAYIQAKDFAKAAPLAEDYTYLRPSDTDFVYLTAYCLKKIGNANRAADFGERVRLRQPRDVRNLINLADVYVMLGNRSRAEELLSQVMTLDPENVLAKKRINSIAQKA